MLEYDTEVMVVTCLLNSINKTPLWVPKHCSHKLFFRRHFLELYWSVWRLTMQSLFGFIFVSIFWYLSKCLNMFQSCPALMVVLRKIQVCAHSHLLKLVVASGQIQLHTMHKCCCSQDSLSCYREPILKF